MLDLERFSFLLRSSSHWTRSTGSWTENVIFWAEPEGLALLLLFVTCVPPLRS